MKTIDKILELTDSENVTADAMLLIEEMIYDEVLDIDAITKWYEIEQGVKENRKIQYIEYEPTSVPKRMIEDLNFDKAVRKKAEQMTNLFFEQMESEQFNKWVYDIEILIQHVKTMA